MRVLSSLLGNVLIALGLLGLVYAGVALRSGILFWPLGVRLDTEATRPSQLPATPTGHGLSTPVARQLPANPIESERAAIAALEAAQTPANAAAQTPDSDDTPLGALPDALSALVSTEISAIKIGRLGLTSEVVPAPIIGVPGGTTWGVPDFVVGHGENTAGAGQAGNAVLLGHVASPNAGSVFWDIGLLRAGDSVRVFSGAREFEYIVTGVRVVPRADLSVLVPTESASLTLLTCTGAWLPALQDYSHRIAVRAELTSVTSES